MAVQTLLSWLLPWDPSPTVVICVLLAATLYLRGAWRSPHSAPWPRQIAFWVGLALIYIALQTHFGYYAQYEFFMHRLQHLGLHHMGPFLIALAYPGAAMRRALPLRLRRRVLNPLLATWPVRWAFRVVFHPLVAGLLFVGLIYFWLWPSVHFVSMLDKRYYLAMNWSMTIDGLLFWWLILDPRPKPPARLGAGMRVLVVLAVIPPQAVLGAYMVFTQRELYPIYAVCGRVFAGISPALDQHLGGLILWVPSAMMSVVGGLVAFAHWTSLSSRHRLVQREPRRESSGQERGR